MIDINFIFFRISVSISGIPRVPPPLLSEWRDTGGLPDPPTNPQILDHLLWKIGTKNTTNFPAAFGGQKGEIQGGEPEEYH